MPRSDRDILLPEQDKPRSRLRFTIPRIRRPVRRAKARSGSVIGSREILRAFEYLVASLAERPVRGGALIDALASRIASLEAQDRFAVQVRLAEALAGSPASMRFWVALQLATRVVVPQARMTLLNLLTQPGLANWRGLLGNEYTVDLRPAVVAALGRLQDPSLLGLFHRLLAKLATKPGQNQPLIIAIQWSLMNLAPGSRGEPVPLDLLAGSLRSGG